MLTHSQIESQPIFYSGVKIDELLFQMDELPRLEPKQNARTAGLGWRDPDEEGYVESPQKVAYDQATAHLRKRVDKFRAVMFGKPPMTSKKIATLMPATSKCKTITPDNVWSGMRRLMESGHVQRVKSGNFVKFKWIGE